MQAAIHLPTATSFEIHQYGRQLLAAKKNQEALEVFKLNAERNGDAWPVNVGLARAYMALGDYKKAADYAQKAAAQAPDVANKKNLEAMAQTLAEGKPYAN
jgi:tetratricopeptide (TPR) repeat protein